MTEHEQEIRSQLASKLEEAAQLSEELVKLRAKSGLATHQEALTDGQIKTAIYYTKQKNLRE